MNYMHLTEGRKPVVDGQSRIYFCELHQYHTDNVFRSFSIKYTLEGHVEYRTENEVHSLLPGYFLISSKQPCVCIVDSKSLTRNLSIDISMDIMAEVSAVLHPGGKLDIDELLHGELFQPDFLEHMYPVHASVLGSQLESIGRSVLQTGKVNSAIPESMFIVLAELIVLHEKPITQAWQALDAIKASTKKETLRRLLNARFFMDEHVMDKIHVQQIARHAHLSEYYFLRTFKKAFGISPYQYLMHKRLDAAKSMLRKHKFIPDVAEQCGFPDPFAFSKAYKKHFGHAPSAESSLRKH